MTDAISGMPGPAAPPHDAPERSGAGAGWFDLVSDYVREHPALTAAIAFQIGTAAGVLTRSAGRGRRPRGRAGASRLADGIAPALAEIAALFASSDPARRTPRKASRRRPAARSPKRRKTRAPRRHAG
ncbi:MAG: hypothetical protein AB7K35_16635 [Pseudorhodoplanes sp.]